MLPDCPWQWEGGRQETCGAEALSSPPDMGHSAPIARVAGWNLWGTPKARHTHVLCTAPAWPVPEVASQPVLPPAAAYSNNSPASRLWTLVIV